MVPYYIGMSYPLQSQLQHCQFYCREHVSSCIMMKYDGQHRAVVPAPSYSNSLYPISNKPCVNCMLSTTGLDYRNEAVMNYLHYTELVCHKVTSLMSRSHKFFTGLPSLRCLITAAAASSGLKTPKKPSQPSSRNLSRSVVLKTCTARSQCASLPMNVE